MTIEQRLDQLQKRNKRLTVALTMTVVAMAAVVTMAAPTVRDVKQQREWAIRVPYGLGQELTCLLVGFVPSVDTAC